MKAFLSIRAQKVLSSSAHFFTFAAVSTLCCIKSEVFKGFFSKMNAEGTLLRILNGSKVTILVAGFIGATYLAITSAYNFIRTTFFDSSFNVELK